MTKTNDELCKCLKRVPSLKRRLLSPKETQARARLLRLMANPTRLQMLRLLSECDICVCVLSSLLGKSQANISQHLGKLKDSGAIGSYSIGKLVYYRLEDRRIRELLRF
jgi:ArsR family transcriptional regulator, lead/cadmium/zinc/bismuth-responsive transcriptional repressor